jgi:hypothetical protein
VRIELRKSGGEACDKCGATELLYVPALAEHLEADLAGHFAQEIPSWRWLKRRRFAHFTREVERVSGELRAKTRFQVH